MTHFDIMRLLIHTDHYVNYKYECLGSTDVPEHLSTRVSIKSGLYADQLGGKNHQNY